MKYLRLTRHKRQSRPRTARCLSGRISRQLRAELLEGRMMLSATAPAPELTWNAFSFAPDDNRQVSFLLKFVPPSSVADGGFINGDVVLMGTGAPQNVNQFDYDSVPTTIDDLLASESTFQTNAYGPATNLESFSDSSLSLRAIDPLEIKSNVTQVLQPGSSHSAAVFTSQEGGLISITSLIASVGSKEEATLPESSLTHSPGTSTSEPESAASAEPLETNVPGRDISGEWARAAVFEIAGGEPLANIRQTGERQGSPVADSNENTAAIAANSKTAGEANGSVARPAIRNDEAPDAAEPASADVHDAAANQPLIKATLSAAVILDETLTLLPVAVPWSDRASLVGAAVLSANAQTDAVAAAFDEIGADDLARSAPSADRPPLNHWLGGTPLLLMFALERVTSRNARRRKTNEVIAKR